MGYTTEFEGVFKVTPTLTPEHREYLHAFGHVRHMKRRPGETENLKDERRMKVGLPVGIEGEYYVGSIDDGNFGQGTWSDREADKSLIDFNIEPTTQPGLWCKWEPTEDGTGIQWTGMEKFYAYTEWLEYLIENFLKPWGYALNGDVDWQGEDNIDSGTLRVVNNVVEEIFDKPDEEFLTEED